MNIQSDLVHLEVLEGAYKNKLTQYESAYATYINSLNKQNSETNNYVVLPGNIYAGTGTISDTINSTLSTCEASCKANPLCSGASFNSISNVCKLRSGNSTLSKGAANDNAIITKVKENIIYLETLNTQLIEINSQITNIYQKMQPMVDTQTKTISINGEELTNRYSLLTNEKIKIKTLLDEYNDIDKSNVDQSLMVEQQNSTYYLWLILCILSILLVIKYTVFPESSGGILTTVVIVTAAVIMIFSTIYLNNPAAYAIWLVIILSIIVIKTNILSF